MSATQFSRTPATVLALALVAALGLGAAALQKGAIGQEESKAASAEKAISHAKQMSLAFRKAAETASPSVVTIRSKTKAKAVKLARKGRANPFQGGRSPFGGQDPFKGSPLEDFFNMPDDLGGQVMQQPREGMGSGVIIDKSGIVLTNNHVVDGADEVTVHLADGRKFVGKDIKVDPQTDLAVVHIEGASDLPAAKLGDSDDLEIGDWVMAIGNPFGLEHTVSAGIISAKGRELRDPADPRSTKRANFLQTDAAINPGNSGGPLINLDGEVIGINTAIATNNGSFAGIGFAIPSNLAKWVVPQLIKNGSVARAYLGVGIGNIDEELADKFGVRRGEGVLIGEVFKGTPAADAGVNEGDVIVSFDNHKVHNPRELQELVERAPLDSKQKIEVVRDGKALKLDFVAKAMPKTFGLAGKEDEAEADETAESSTSSLESSKLGLEVADLSAKDVKALGYPESTGVVVSQVDPNGLAANKGLTKGALILEVGKTPVNSVEEFRAAVQRESLKDGILLKVRTKAGKSFVVLHD